MNSSALKKLISARVDLICDQPFFGALSLSLTLKEDTTCQTAWVDGRDFGYNPSFVESLPHAEICGLVAHEIMHCALGHPWRKDGREHRRFNIACDLAINGDLKDCFDADTRSFGRVRFALPKGVLLPNTEQQGKSAEWIYARLPESPKDKNGNGQGAGTPDPAGEVRDAPTGQDDDGTPAPTEGEWKQRTAEALQAAKMQGALGAGLSRMIETALDKKIDPRSLLLRFMSERARGDYSYSMPNPRYIAHGLYLPKLHSVEMGECAIVIDTSGSVDAQSLAFARGIVEDVMSEVNPSAVSVWYSDAKVCRVDRFAQGEPLNWQPTGGGGTSFVDALKKIEDEGTAVCVLVITDMCGTFPASCDLPVLWLATTDVVAPFGETVPLGQ